MTKRPRNLQVRRPLVLLSFFLLNSLFCFSQENPKGEIHQYAEKIVDTLASPSMHGRGYVNGGDSIAAKYIADRFKEFGLMDFQKAKNNYYQRFSFPINTFPGGLGFFLNPLDAKNTDEQVFSGKPGQNFLINPDSPNTNSLFYAYIFDSTDATEARFKKFKRRLNKKPFFIIADDRKVVNKEKLKYFEKVKSNCFNAVGIAEFTKKLTWDQSQTIRNYARIQIAADSFNVKQKKLQGSITVINEFIPSHPSQNVIGYIKGSQFPDSFIVYTAHYDHLGAMGLNDNIPGKENYFPGANDNASGCAMLLSLAKYYSAHPPKYSIAFMAFGGEEVGLLGSKYYTEHPLFPMKQIKFLINFDIMGTGDEGIKVVNATEFPLQFKTLQKLNAQGSYVKEVSPRGKTQNSDHYFFYANGVKCFFIYTLGGIKAYHDIYDRAETLPLTKFESVYNLMIDYTEWLQLPK